MKKVLILSYHFAPLNVIASNRANSYARYFHESGLMPTVVTHNWGDESNFKKDELENKVIYRLPYHPVEENNIERKLSSNGILNKLNLLRKWFSGYFDNSPLGIDSYYLFKNFLYQHLKEENYDMVLAVFSPHHHLKLAYEIHNDFKIPYVLDFRDLWDNRIVHDSFDPGFVLRIKYGLIRKKWKKWLGNASFLTTISHPWVEVLEKLSNNKGYRITHGYEEDIASLDITDNNDQFVIAYAGSTSIVQDLEMFALGAADFISQAKDARILIYFMGSKKFKKDQVGAHFIDPSDYLSKHIDQQYFKVTERKPREEVLGLFKQANILLMPTYKDHEGTYSGKIFEYLGTGKNILVFPSDKSVIEELIVETKSGTVVNNAQEISAYLLGKYEEWKEHGKCKYSGDHQVISNYSRKHQVKMMGDYIIETLKSN